MKKINYSDRSSFYDFEVSKDEKIMFFLKEIANKLNIKKIINCPCASGVYLEEFSNYYENSLFIDIDDKMIDRVNKKIIKYNYKNVKTLKLDIKKLYELDDNMDCIIMLNQGLQYIKMKELEKLLKKLNTNYLILDLFDFTKGGQLTYFDSNKYDEYYLSREFNINNKNIKRYNRYIIKDGKVYFKYVYYVNNSKVCETEFELYNYSFESINDVIKESNYELINIYGDYEFKTYSNVKGHYILILRRCGCEI